jgi:transposase-like protein
MSKRSRTKSYPAEFREKAVRLVTERGYTLKQVAEQLDCSEESVRRWKEAKTQTLDSTTAQRMERDEDENKWLRKENARLKQENEILKKATAYFAKEVM